jgi:fucose permease
MLYCAAGCLVAAQILGVYALRTRKADLIFSIFMVGFVVASVMLGYLGARQQLG